MWRRRKLLIQLPERILPSSGAERSHLFEKVRNASSPRLGEQAFRQFEAHDASSGCVELLPPLLSGIPQIFRSASAFSAHNQPTKTAEINLLRDVFEQGLCAQEPNSFRVNWNSTER